MSKYDELHKALTTPSMGVHHPLDAWARDIDARVTALETRSPEPARVAVDPPLDEPKRDPQPAAEHVPESEWPNAAKVVLTEDVLYDMRKANLQILVDRLAKVERQRDEAKKSLDARNQDNTTMFHHLADIMQVVNPTRKDGGITLDFVKAVVDERDAAREQLAEAVRLVEAIKLAVEQGKGFTTIAKAIDAASEWARKLA